MATKTAPATKKAAAAPKKAVAPPKAPAREKVPPQDNVDLLDDLPVMATIELGRTTSTLAEATSLGKQSVIELDRRVADPVDILLNGKLFARGEVVTVDENFGVRIVEIIGRP